MILATRNPTTRWIVPLGVAMLPVMVLCGSLGAPVGATPPGPNRFSTPQPLPSVAPTATHVPATTPGADGVPLTAPSMQPAIDGSGWSVQSAADATAPEGSLSGVSCVSSTDCLAVGTYADAFGGQDALAEAWNGTAWSIVPARNKKDTATALNAVSSVQLRVPVSPWGITSTVLVTVSRGPRSGTGYLGSEQGLPLRLM